MPHAHELHEPIARNPEVGGTATGEFIDQAMSATPVEAEPHTCAGGVAICGDRGFDLVTTNTPSPEVVLSVPFSGTVNEQEQ